MEDELIGEYELDVINFNGTPFTPGFELYKSRGGKLAWSPYKEGGPHINPVKGVNVSSVNELDIARILAQITMFEFKTTDVSPDAILRDNRSLVARILRDIKK